MASRLAREQVARAARVLNARCWARSGPRALPSLILMTDEHRVADPIAAARALPHRAAIVLRHREPKTRAALAEALASVARARGLILLIAGDAALAARVRAQGLHLPENRALEAAHWKAMRPDWLITVAAHSARTLARASMTGADAALLAPVFPSLSHVERGGIGASRFRLMAAQARLPVYALGGVNGASIGRLAGARIAGIAAIETLLPD